MAAVRVNASAAQAAKWGGGGAGGWSSAPGQGPGPGPQARANRAPQEGGEEHSAEAPPGPHGGAVHPGGRAGVVGWWPAQPQARPAPGAPTPGLVWRGRLLAPADLPQGDARADEPHPQHDRGAEVNVDHGTSDKATPRCASRLRPRVPRRRRDLVGSAAPPLRRNCQSPPWRRECHA